NGPAPERVARLDERLAPRMADDELVVDRRGPGMLERQAQRQPGEQLAIARREVAARHVPDVEVAQLDAQHRRLDLIQSAAVAELHVVVTAGVAVMAQSPDVLGHVVAVGEQQAAVAARAEVLGGVGGKATDVAPSADWPVAPS